MTENRPGRPGDVDTTASSPAPGESKSLKDMLSDARARSKGQGVVQGSTIFFKGLAESIGHSNRNLKIGLAFLTAAFVVVAAALGTLVFQAFRSQVATKTTLEKQIQSMDAATRKQIQPVLDAMSGLEKKLAEQQDAQRREVEGGAELPEAGATLWQALATPAFWAFSLTISLWGMIYSGVALFNEDIFKERGFDRDLYFDVLTLVTVVALASKLAFGWLTRFVPLQKLLGVCLLVTAGCLLGLPHATETWHVYLYGVAMGIASGAVALLFFATWGKLYGQRQLGRIQGVAQMLTVLASAAGPLVFALGKRWSDSYANVFLVLSALVFVQAVIVWFVPLPRFPEEETR